jgi:hypothetical protein
MHNRPVIWQFALLASFFISISAASAGSEVSLKHQNPLLAGESPQIQLSGLPKNQIIRLHSLRSLPKWERDQSGQWKQVSVVLHAWADYNSGRKGRVDVDKTAPIAGSFTSANSTGFIWSGYPRSDTALAAVQAEFDASTIKREKDITLFVTQKNQLLAQSSIAFEKDDQRATFTDIQQDGWSGVYAAPRSKGPHPVVIVLHGSEGGNMGMARMHAARFASRGYAALAMNYFAYPHDPIAKNT